MDTPDNAVVIKCCLLGFNGVGKSSLVRNFIDPDQLGVSDNLTGTSVVTHSFEIDGVNVRGVFCYNRTGERFICSPMGLLYGATCAMVVYDVTDRPTFDKLGGWVRMVELRGISSGVICIVGNKCEDASARKVSSEEGRLFALHHGALFFETSSLTGMNVQEMFLQTLSSAMKSRIPVSVRRREPNAYCVQQ